MKLETPKLHNKVRAVLVLPNDIVCDAADCSRDGVHAVARLLMKHYDKASGSRMFMSRQPCPMCAKLLVQSKVVLFLPFESEYYRSSEEIDQSNEESQKSELHSATEKETTGGRATTESQKKELHNATKSLGWIPCWDFDSTWKVLKLDDGTTYQGGEYLEEKKEQLTEMCKTVIQNEVIVDQEEVCCM